MPHYRMTRTLPSGWQMRIECVTYDAGFTSSPLALDGVVLTELGTLKVEYDTMPYGLMSPMTFSLKLIWNNLPSDLRDRLENGFQTYGAYNFRNTWYIFTDRGTNGSTWTLEFAGVEDNIEALELESLTQGLYSYNVELVDICYYHLKTRTCADFLPHGASLGRGYRSVYQVLNTGTGFNQTRTQEFEFWSLDAEGYMISVQDILRLFRTTSSAAFSSVSHTTGGFDSTDQLQHVMTHAISYFPCASTTAIPRVAGATPVANSLLFVVGEIKKGPDVIGGVLSANDQFGIVTNTLSQYDLLRQFAEQSCVRVGYRFAYTTSGGAINQIQVVFDVKAITQARDYNIVDSNVDQTLSLDDSLSYSNITVRGDNILKVETRYETTSDKDATQLVRIREGARASRSYNFEPVLLNVPVDVQDNNDANDWPRFKAPIKQTNLLFTSAVLSGGGSQMIKVHEKTRVRWGNAVGDVVTVDPTGLQEPVYASDFKTNPATRIKYFLQINDCQVNGGATAAVVTALLQIFSNEKNAILEADWIISTNTKVLHDYISGKYQLTGNVTTTFDQLAWSRVMPVSMEIDFFADTVKHKYMLVK